MNIKHSMTILLAIGIALTAGCARPIPCQTPACEQARQWETRIDAARQISSFTIQDKALSTITIEASEHGNLKYALKALRYISSFVLHDKVADQAVTLFLNQDRPSAANKIAGRIHSFTAQDRALTRIAKHPIDHPASVAQ